MLCPSCQTENPDGAEACVECAENLRLAAPGAVLADRYEILGRLGKGGMGVVYKARDRLLNEIVAIKILRPGGGATSEMAQRFLSEIKLARSVSHRNVCRIHEYGEDAGLKYISMAYVDGVDLKNVLWQNGPMAAAEAYPIMIQVAEGLAAIHAEGIIHRDLKTANIMMDSTRRYARLMDFGIAKQWSDESGVGMTGTGQIVGSPDYMSPEQIQAKKIDFRSDIYSFGIVVYETFTARLPFHADTPVATLMKHLQEPPVLEGPGAPPLPAPLIPVLKKALEKDPERRYASVDEVRLALMAARDSRSDATRTTHVPNLKATLRVPGAVHADDALPVVNSTAAGKDAADSTPTEASSFPPTLPRKTAPSQRPSVRGESRVQPVVRASGGPSRALIGLAAVLVLAGLAVLFFVLPRLRQGEPAATPQVTSAPATMAAMAAMPTTPATIPTTLAPAPTAVPAAPPPSTAAPTITRPPATTLPARESTPAPPPTAPADTRPSQADNKAREQAAQVKALLASAEQALEAQDYDAAVRTYDAALGLDPQNQVAMMGRSTAVNARVTARASAGSARGEPGRKLVAGTTSAQSQETRTAEASLPPGFKATPGVAVTRDTQAADLPGQITFETEPAEVVPNANYTVRILFANPGAAPVEIDEMVLTTNINGRKSVGGVPPQTRIVGPKQQVLLRALSDMWRGDVKAWSLEVVVRTARGETYKNTLLWK